MSSETRQRFTLYQFQCRAQIDTLFYIVLCLFHLSSYCLVAAFELWNLHIFLKISSGQAIGTRTSNFQSKALNPL
jgi:hypothetical protein